MKRSKRILPILMAWGLLAGCASADSTGSYASSASWDASRESEVYESTDMAPEEQDTNLQTQTLYDQAVYEEKLSYSVYLDMQTLDYDGLVSAIQEQITQYKGYVESQSCSDYDTSWYRSSASVSQRSAWFLARIPTESYEDFLEAVSALGKVTCKSVDVENITQSYYDTSVSVQALLTEQSKLLELMEQAQSVEDIISIETRLSQVESQLRQLQEQMAQMDQSVSYSSIRISVDEVSEYQDLEMNQFSRRFQNALTSTWTNFAAVLQNFCIWLVYALPFVLAAALVLAGAWFWEKKRNKTHPEGRMRFWQKKNKKEKE